MATRRIFKREWFIGLVSFLAWSLVFGVIYAQSPLYTSNQNAYFLHGLADAGFGYLKNDWLATRQESMPVFTWLVYLTYTALPQQGAFLSLLCLADGSVFIQHGRHNGPAVRLAQVKNPQAGFPGNFPGGAFRCVAILIIEAGFGGFDFPVRRRGGRPAHPRSGLSAEHFRCTAGAIHLPISYANIPSGPWCRSQWRSIFILSISWAGRC